MMQQTPPITVTEAAKARIEELTARKDGARGIALRIAQGKGCGGNEYKMDHITEEAPGFDRIKISEKATLYIPLTDSFLMFGMTIDYGKDPLGNEQFLFTNPNEVERCGCGESFSLKPAE